MATTKTIKGLQGVRPEAAERKQRPSWTARALLAWTALNAIGAAAGGISLAARPDGSVLGMGVDTLKREPFGDFLIPGLALAVVVGGGMLLGALTAWRRWRWAPEVSFLAGSALLVFEFVELWAIGYASWLQPAFFGAAALTMALAAQMWRERRA